MVKITIILRRNSAMTHDEFVTYHREHHAPLFCSLPEVRRFVRRYVQCHALEHSFPGVPDNKIDGSTELWFDDRESMAALFNAPGYLKTIRADEAKFLNLQACEFLIGSEAVIIRDSAPVPDIDQSTPDVGTMKVNNDQSTKSAG